MKDASSNSSEVKDTDIVFDCPHCGKSLAIDYRGAGLTIPCSDCGRSVEVPIPEGMEISDIDSSEEEQEMRILNLRRSLAEAEARIAELETSLEEMTARREVLEKQRVATMQRFADISEQVGVLQSAFRQMTEAAETINRTALGEEKR